MRDKTKRRVRIIYEQTPADFESRINEAFDMIEDPTAEIEYNHQKGFCAYITYSEKERIPETVRDRFSLEGIRYECRSCPYCEMPENPKVQRTYCDMKPSGVTFPESEACEYFYKLVALGEVDAEQIEVAIRKAKRKLGRV